MKCEPERRLIFDIRHHTFNKTGIMKRILYIFFLALAGCHSMPKNSVVIENCPWTQKLHGDSIDIFDEELGIAGLYDAGDFILCASHRTDYHFSVYSKNNCCKLKNIFKVGRGAGEFIAPAYFSRYQTENKETKIWILERALNRFFKINLTKTITQDSLYIEKEYDLSLFRNSDYRAMYLLKDDLLLATEDQQDCKHTLLNLIEKKKEIIPTALPFPDRSNVHEISQVVSTKHPTRSYIASAFFNFPQIDFLNGQGRYKTVFYFQVIFPLQTTISQRDDEYFSNICCDTNFVYALYNSSDQPNHIDSEILIFSWQGEAIGKCIIPFATFISIDRKNNRLYAMNPRKENYNTSIYDLAQIKELNLMD